MKDKTRLLVSSRDRSLLRKGSVVRLMELFNIQVEAANEAGIATRFHSEAYEEARRLRAPLIHWLPSGGGVPCEVVMPDGSVVKGLAEEASRKTASTQIVQFERFGFVKVDRVDDEVLVFFAHK